jgi:hypothetical protein
MTVAPDTITGTITLTTGSAAFTTAGVNMLTRAHKPGDTIKRFGLDLVIATITDENTGTLTELCPDLPAGISGNATPVRIRFQPDGARVTAQARNLIDAVGDMVTRFKPADIANPSEIVLYEATANGVHKLTLRPPAALTADRVFVFPDVDYSNITDLFGQWTRASAAGPSSLVFLEDTDEGANKVTLRAAAALGADVEFVMDAHGADLLLRWTRATAAAPASLDFHEDTDDGVHRMRVSVPALTADRLFTLPDANVAMHAASKGLLEAADAPGQRDAIGLDAVAALGGAYAAGGTASAATVTIAELWGGYASGQVLAIKMPSAAPGATTLNVTVPVVGALGAKAIRRQGDAAIQVNDWIAGAVLVLRYDAAYNAAAGAWVMMNSSPGFSTIAFEAHGSVNVLNGTLTKLAAGTEAIDVGGYYDAAANYRFQPPAGYYYLHAAAGPDGSGYGLSVDTGYVVLSLYKNGALYRTLSYVQASTTTGLIAVGGCTVYSNGTDYWEAYMLHQSSATKQCIVEFGGIRVGS